MSTLLRPITAADHPAVLEWNERYVHLLSPMDADRLRYLVEQADTAALITDDGQDAGFVITVAGDAAYDSENYRWFAARHRSFLYLDRVVIDSEFRRSGLASRVYDLLEQDAAERAEVFCLEVNIDPPNEASLAFHRGRGFVEVGRKEAFGHVVALFAKEL